MDRFWERYIQSRPAPGESKGAFDAFAAAHKEPRITAQEPRIGLQGGQLVQPGVGRQGYKGEKPVAGSFDEFSDAVLNSYAKDDITFIKDYKYSNNITRSKTNSRGYLDKLVEKTGCSF